ncbi:MAG: hypothetical protein ABJQ29_07365 [Luteolibacter sp.]
MKFKIRHLWLLLFLASFLMIFVGTHLHLRRLVFVKKLITDAEVVEYEPSNFSSVYYEYEVNGVIYSGVASAEGYDRGDRVKIYYAVDRNHVSELVENIPTPKDFVGFSILGSLWISCGGTLVFWFSHKLVGGQRMPLAEP